MIFEYPPIRRLQEEDDDEITLPLWFKKYHLIADNILGLVIK